MPFRCREKECAKRFSAKTGTIIEGSKLGFQVWMIATYQMKTSLKSVSSMKLQCDLNINQRSAWFLAHRLRVALADEGGVFSGPVEIDETYMGGKMKNMHGKQRREARQKPDLGKTIVAGAHAAPDATNYTDEARAYSGLPNRESVNHSAGEYVRDDGVSTNGMESFWSMIKRSQERDTIDMMGAVTDGGVGKRLCYRELIADNGLDSGARS